MERASAFGVGFPSLFSLVSRSRETDSRLAMVELRILNKTSWGHLRGARVTQSSTHSRLNHLATTLRISAPEAMS